MAWSGALNGGWEQGVPSGSLEKVEELAARTRPALCRLAWPASVCGCGPPCPSAHDRRSKKEFLSGLAVLREAQTWGDGCLGRSGLPGPRERWGQSAQGWMNGLLTWAEEGRGLSVCRLADRPSSPPACILLHSGGTKVGGR